MAKLLTYGRSRGKRLPPRVGVGINNVAYHRPIACLSVGCVCVCVISECDVSTRRENYMPEQRGHERVLTSWAAATICPRPSPPPWVPKRLAPPSRRQRSSSFPRPTRSHAHRCSRLTCQHGGEVVREWRERR